MNKSGFDYCQLVKMRSLLFLLFAQSFLTLGQGVKVILNPFKDPFFIHKRNTFFSYDFSTENNANISVQCFAMDFAKCVNSTIDGMKRRFCEKSTYIKYSTEVSVSVDLEGETYCVVQAITGPHPDQFENLPFIRGDPEMKPGNVSTTCDCGRRYISPALRKLQNSTPFGRLYIGEEARRGEFTWMVGIHNEDLFLRCGGSLITHHHVLTAGHCVTKVIPGYSHTVQDTWVSIGKMSRKFELSDFGKLTEIDKNDIYVPEEYLRTKNFNYDLAVLYMKNRVRFGLRVGPTCLPKVYPHDMTYSKVLIAGWGLNEDQKLAGRLQFTRLYTIPTELCRIRHHNMICLYQKDTGTCRGDSGGAVMRYDRETNRYFQMSLVSHGFTKKCTPGFTATTNLTQHYDWIEKIVKSI